MVVLGNHFWMPQGNFFWKLFGCILGRLNVSCFLFVAGLWEMACSALPLFVQFSVLNQTFLCHVWSHRHPQNFPNNPQIRRKDMELPRKSKNNDKQITKTPSRILEHLRNYLNTTSHPDFWSTTSNTMVHEGAQKAIKRKSHFHKSHLKVTR